MSMGARAFAYFQYVLPQHAMSRLVYRATRVRVATIKNALIGGFLRLYDVNMAEAQQPNPFAFGSFNEFFTRAIRPEARPINAAQDAIACPVDGTLSECGSIAGNLLLQAKHHRYALEELLTDNSVARGFRNGCFATIYLAPYNYHRIHMPLDGELLDTIYVPGRLFSVNSATAQQVPRLFARNERVITLFETRAGRMAVILVGALHVGSMATVWNGDITPAAQRVLTRLPPQKLKLAKGAELGRFNMGSTVILLFEPGRATLARDLTPGRTMQLGEALGQVQGP
jgi:phosphatidylserine decarboxylase